MRPSKHDPNKSWWSWRRSPESSESRGGRVIGLKVRRAKRREADWKHMFNTPAVWHEPELFSPTPPWSRSRALKIWCRKLRQTHRRVLMYQLGPGSDLLCIIHYQLWVMTPSSDSLQLSTEFHFCPLLAALRGQRLWCMKPWNHTRGRVHKTPAQHFTSCNHLTAMLSESHHIGGNGANLRVDFNGGDVRLFVDVFDGGLVYVTVMHLDLQEKNRTKTIQWKKFHFRFQPCLFDINNFFYPLLWGLFLFIMFSNHFILCLKIKRNQILYLDQTVSLLRFELWFDFEFRG